MQLRAAVAAFCVNFKVEKGRDSNPKVDQLFKSPGSEFDEKKWLKIFRDLAWMIHNDVAGPPLCLEIR